MIEAEHGIITNDPREITLDHPHLSREDGTCSPIRRCSISARKIRSRGFWPRETSPTAVRGCAKARRLSATPSQSTDSPLATQPSKCSSRADQAEFLLEGNENLLRTATLTGNVHYRANRTSAHAGRCWARDPRFRRPEPASESSRSRWRPADAESGQLAINRQQKDLASGPQDFELTAPIIDFTVAQGHMLRRAVTSGAAQITICQAQGSIRAFAGSLIRSNEQL